MQLRLTLTGNPILLPINYRPLIHGLIYKALADYPDYFDAIHNLNHPVTKKSYKGFTFSPLQGNYRIEDRMIMFSNEVQLEIRSAIPMTIAYLFHYFKNNPNTRLGEQELEITSCEMQDVRVQASHLSVRMISPAVAYVTEESGFIHYYRPDEAAFTAALSHNAARKAEYFNIPCQTVLHAEVVSGSPIKKQVSSFKKTMITGWFCDLELWGEPLVLDLLYQTGIGSKNSEGFGMFQLLQNN